MNIPCRFRPLGDGGLPPGYKRVEFLENTGTQYLALPVAYGRTSGFAVRYKVKPYPTYNYLSIIRYSGKFLNVGRIAGDSVTGIAASSSPSITAFVENNGKIFAAYNEYESGKIKVASQGEEKETDIPHTPAYGETVTPLYLMAYDREANLGVFLPSLAHYSLYEARFTLGPKLVNRFVPALDPTGTPCMFDTVSKQAFKNDGSGQFIAGVKNASQLRTVLRKLPDRTEQETGTLTLSIPADANTPEMQELLDTTESQKNWELTIQERAAAVSTYMLRRVRKMVWVRRGLSEYGGYVAADGSRWLLEWCSAIYSPRGNNPALHGYEPFGSVEEACEAWGLVPYEVEQDEI